MSTGRQADSSRSADRFPGSHASDRPTAPHLLQDNMNKEETPMYAVMGIAGQVGGAVANSLLQKNEKVRAIVRNAEKAAEWKARGVEIALADVDDPEALKGV